MRREELVRRGDNLWEVPQGYKNCMRAPGRLYSSDELLPDVEEDCLEQLANVACLPGIHRYSIAMPDTHLGYGFPIGGVAALDAEEGVVSPGSVGFDINCGIRVLRTDIRREELTDVKGLVDSLFERIPSGVGSKSEFRVSKDELKKFLERGSQHAVDEGFGRREDYEHCEENGMMEEADSSKVSERALERGKAQIGTLGSGNHFTEVQYVDEVYDEEAAEVFGLFEDQVLVMIHTGSRGFGHQVATDYIKRHEDAMERHGVELPDRQLAAAPAQSREGQDYLAAMACAMNYSWSNRQMLTHWAREVVADHLDMDEEALGLDVVYDVAHNTAKRESYEFDGERRDVHVHRKGATRSFGPGLEAVPERYRDVGQPVLIAGTMGSPSFVLHGTDTAMEESFGTTCHGAGRTMSRTAAKKKFWGRTVQEELAERQMYVRATSGAVLAEEAPLAYKESQSVVDIVDRVGLSRKVVKVQPMGTIKG
ncbi:MAG: tRNA-splicing ligase RtcB [Methanonatronarchaeales archaeon]|nr:tRNA-splicing ligase RtcB [Methanonatronarchaeales archaeon]